MNGKPSATPLTDKALARLRALARGNGLDPEKIVLTAGEENIYVLEGNTTLKPLFETSEKRYTGPPQDRNSKISANFEALHAEVEKRKKAYESRPDWIEDVREELRREPAEGWGFHDARVELPKRSYTLAASENCKTCKGEKNILCTRCSGRGYELCHQCHGQRQEFCYNCNYSGSGSGPGSSQIGPGQICHICSNHRYIPCRTCHATGQTACPICKTRGSTPCASCKGTGQTTAEIRIICGATTHFDFKAVDASLPSSMRRGLDRLGVINLAKGHAEITSVHPEAGTPDHDHEDEKPDEVIPGGLYGVAPPIKPLNKTPDEVHEKESGPRVRPPAANEPLLRYQARMPFADLRVDFGGQKAAIGVFGLRSVFLDVPPYLDAFMEPALAKLKEAVKGHGTVDAAIEIRALREALELNLQAKGNLKEFRRFYPLGISNAVAEKILRGTHQSIKRLTQNMRVTAAVVSTLIGAGIFAGCFFSPLPQRLAGAPKWEGIAFDTAPLALACALGWAAVNSAAYFDLHKHFPGTKIGFRQAVGKIGAALPVILVIAWLAMLVLSPARPPWLPPLVH